MAPPGLISSTPGSMATPSSASRVTSSPMLSTGSPTILRPPRAAEGAGSGLFSLLTLGLSKRAKGARRTRWSGACRGTCGGRYTSPKPEFRTSSGNTTCKRLNTTRACFFLTSFARVTCVRRFLALLTSPSFESVLYSSEGLFRILRDVYGTPEICLQWYTVFMA